MGGAKMIGTWNPHMDALMNMTKFGAPIQFWPKNMWFGEAYPWIQKRVFFFPSNRLWRIFLPAGSHGGVTSMPFCTPIKLPVLMWKTFRSSMIRPMNHADDGRATIL